MGNKNVIIKLHQNRIWFNPDLSIDFTASNLPLRDIGLSPKHEVYWVVEQLSFDKDSGRLIVKILDYFLRDIAKFSDQQPKAAVRSILFTNLSDADNLKLALRYYSRQMNELDRSLEEGYRELKGINTDRPEGIARRNPLFRSYSEREKLEVNFEVWFKEAEFKLGYVAFEKDIKELKQMLRFRVVNDFILPEFELIKGYFARALGTRKFDVKASIMIHKGKPVETFAASSIIKRIDENLIDSIRNARVNMLMRTPFKGNADKSLFTSEDVFDEFGDSGTGNVFHQSEEDILKHILEKMNVRNRKQIEYLAGVKQAPGARLKFTLHPYFGFLFTVEGEKMMHFIWELLNTHATYIWSLDKGEEDMRIQFRRVEDAINRVRNSGREQYKLAWRSSHVDQDLLFNVIHHEDANSPFIEGFVKWRHRLGELLI